jgi:hypothetical protein
MRDTPMHFVCDDELPEITDDVMRQALATNRDFVADRLKHGERPARAV